MLPNPYHVSSLIPKWCFPVFFCDQFHTALDVTSQVRGRPRSATRKNVSNGRRTRVPVTAHLVLEEGTRLWALLQSSQRPLQPPHLPARRRKKVALNSQNHIFIYLLLSRSFYVEKGCLQHCVLFFFCLTYVHWHEAHTLQAILDKQP